MTESLHATGYGDLTGVPDLRRVLRSEPWRERAACRDEEDPMLHFYECAVFRSEEPHLLRSPSLLLPLLICEGCTVRRECLRAAVAPPAYNHDDAAVGVETRTQGVWGGTVELDRVRVKSLPVDEQIEVLEATFPERLERRIAAWRANDSPRPMRSRRGARIVQMLEARAVTAAAPRPAAYGRCGERLSWRARSDARYCSAACRQAGYRARAAA